MSDVAGWLDRLGLAKYASLFADNEVDLDVLRRISEDDLRELGLPLGARRKILQAVAELEEQHAATASRAADRMEHASAVTVERRQITVMFTDVVGSTSLSGQIDVEDLRSLVLAYQQACTEAIERHGGYVAQYLGDGVLAYFGYPEAHEDDAVRAVRAALALMQRMPEINQRLLAEHGVGLEVRAGLHTGLVVAGEVGAGKAREQLAVGETPNIAARVQAVAEAGSVVVSDATWRLVEGFFTAEPLGAQSLKGVSRPVPVHRIVAATGVVNPFEVRAARSLTPLVGREAELTVLRKRWEQATEGEGWAVFLQGEAGIGKSRLMRAFRDLLEPAEHQAVTLNCSAQHQASAFYPVADQLSRAAGLEPGDDDSARQGKLSAFIGGLGLAVDRLVPPLAALLGVVTDESVPKVAADPAILRREAVAAVLRIVVALAESRSLLFVVEDLHWIDPSTQELIGNLLDAIKNQRVMIVLTARPEYQPPWTALAHVSTLSLSRLSRRETDAMIRRVAQAELAPDVLAQLVSKTDGIPLFIEELTKYVQDAGVASERRSISVPATLQDALTARLDRLAPVRELIQVAALLGRVFDADVLKAVTGLDQEHLERSLTDLTEAGLVYPRSHQQRQAFEFKHALIQEAALNTLVRERRALLSSRIAEAVERLHPEIPQRQPEVLAHHLQQAGDDGRAWSFWRAAGELAAQRSGSREAASHFTRATECLKRLAPDTVSPEQEAALYTGLAGALMQAEGYRSKTLADAIDSARHAARKSSSPSLEVQVALQAAPLFYGSGRNAEYLAIAQALVPKLSGGIAPSLIASIHLARGIAHFNRAEHTEADHDFRNAVRLIKEVPAESRAKIGGGDLTIVALQFIVLSQRILGRLEQARRTGIEAERIGRSLDDPFSLAWALMARAEGYLAVGEHASALRDADETVAICRQHGFSARLGHALTRRGMARANLGELEQGISDCRDGLMLWRGSGVVFATAGWASELAELLLRAGAAPACRAVLDDVDGLVSGTDDTRVLAERQRLRAMIAAADGNVTEAERYYEAAIATARGQGALLFELRATTRLAELLATQGREADAASRLGAVYASFTEGHRAPDLRAAKEVLDRLST